MSNLHLYRLSTWVALFEGGQKSSVAFAKITWHKPHILLLDEPSNHLDLDAVEALIGGLAMFQGGVLIVSLQSYLQGICSLHSISSSAVLQSRLVSGIREDQSELLNLGRVSKFFCIECRIF
ncbi:unnamed protein product [Calypogeia fissa]